MSRHVSEAERVARSDAADAREDAHFGKLSVSSWAETARAAVQADLSSWLVHNGRVTWLMTEADGYLVSHNGIPVRVRVEAIAGAEWDALVGKAVAK